MDGVGCPTASHETPTAGGKPGPVPGPEQGGTLPPRAGDRPPSSAAVMVTVAELTPDQIENAWDESLYFPPTDPDPFVRCQKIVIAYCLRAAPTVSKARYTRDFAYRQARKVARPLAALGAGIPLRRRDFRDTAFWIYDALMSWAAADDHAAHAIARVFEAYAIPRGTYDQVEVPKTPKA